MLVNSSDDDDGVLFDDGLLLYIRILYHIGVLCQIFKSCRRFFRSYYPVVLLHYVNAFFFNVHYIHIPGHIDI